MEYAPVDSPYGWIVAGAAAISQFVALGSLNSFGVFFGPLHLTFGVGAASLAAVVSLANFVAPVTGTFAGATADRHGVQGLIALAAVCQGASYFVASLASDYATFLFSYGLLAGISAGLTISPSLRLVGQWFEEKRSTAMGVTFAGAGLGQVVLSPLASLAVSRYGWRVTFRLLATLSMVVVVASVAMRRRITPASKCHSGFSAGQIVRRRGFAPLFAVGFFFSYGFFIPIVHVVFYAQRHGVEAVRAGALLSTLGLLTTVGNIVWGGIADRYGNMPVFRVCHFVSGMALCLWPSCTTLWTLVPFTIVTGFFNGGCVTCYPALAAEVFPPHLLGAAISLIYTGFGMGSLVGPVITGWIVDVTQTYTYAAGLGGASFFMAVWVAGLLPEAIEGVDPAETAGLLGTRPLSAA